MNKLIVLVLGLIAVGCTKFSGKNKLNYDDFGDTLYDVQWFNYPSIENPSESVEYYVSVFGDTIVNQFTLYKDGVIDTLNSEFYDLRIRKTPTPDLYNAILTLHTRFDTLQVNAKNKRRLQLLYLEITDSILVSSVISESTNRLEFSYRNTIDDQLIGVIIQDVFRDTVINQEEMLNYGKTRLLVNTKTPANNFFISSHRFLKIKRKGNEYGYFME